MTSRSTGWILILAALGLLIANMADAVKDLQDWHGATTPQFVSALLRQAGATILAAVGGKILPTRD